jgi:hypothetical protein
VVNRDFNLLVNQTAIRPNATIGWMVSKEQIELPPDSPSALNAINSKR